jgi:LysR family glycine cleavage system transcriptional activator
MSRQIPPLPALRAFEAAARLGGFSKASEELCVSPGAIAHQVKQLEEWLGFDLFLRKPRSVELTEPGNRFFKTVHTLLDDLATAAGDLRRWAGDKEVTVTAMPSFVTRWLMPRLGQFRRRFPDIEVRLLASVPPVDFVRDRVDVAIRLGTGPYHGAAWEPLLDEHFYPVCSPGFLKEFGRITSPSDLLGAPLLHDEYEARIPLQISWAQWFASQGLDGMKRRASSGSHFSHTYLTLDAAASGQGIALGSNVLTFDAVQAGLLKHAINAPVQGPYRYHLLRSALSASKEPVKQFCAWLTDEAAQFTKQR